MVRADASKEDDDRAATNVRNDGGASPWVALQDQFNAMLGPLGDLALAAARVEKGHRVLDVGCGCGATTAELASRVGNNGHVVGVDVSQEMVECATERCREFANVEVIEADAQIFDTTALGVDRVVSRFGLMFFADLYAGFANLRSALVPGGRLAFVCWQSIERNPWFSFVQNAVADVVELQAPPMVGPGPFSLADHETMAQVLFGAGFSDVEIASHEQGICLGGPGSVAETVEFAASGGSMGRAIAADPSIDEAVRERLFEAVEARWSDGALTLKSAVWVATASA